MKTRVLTVLGLIIACVGLVSTSAQAVTNGTFDGDNHPYVAY